MFIQVITGTVTDLDGMSELGERWQTELRPGAVGFLGSTEGVTDDDRFVVLARFASLEAAQRNSDRPEQGEWWADMEKVTENVTVHDCSRVETLLGGGKDDATFVQVMQGHILDRDRANAMFSRAGDAEQVLGQARPDVIGEVIALHDDGDGYTDVVYFTSEADARANETKPMPDAAQAMMQEFELALDVTEYLDLGRLRLR